MFGPSIVLGYPSSLLILSTAAITPAAKLLEYHGSALFALPLAILNVYDKLVASRILCINDGTTSTIGIISIVELFCSDQRIKDDDKDPLLLGSVSI